MMIRRIDVAYTPTNQLNINFDQRNSAGLSPPDTQSLSYTPVTRLANGIQSPESPLLLGTPSLLLSAPSTAG